MDVNSIRVVYWEWPEHNVCLWLQEALIPFMLYDIDANVDNLILWNNSDQGLWWMAFNTLAGVWCGSRPSIDIRGTIPHQDFSFVCNLFSIQPYGGIVVGLLDTCGEWRLIM